MQQIHAFRIFDVPIPERGHWHTLKNGGEDNAEVPADYNTC